MTAAPITAAGRFSPRGPRGMGLAFFFPVVQEAKLSPGRKSFIVFRDPVHHFLGNIVVHFLGERARLCSAVAPMLRIVSERTARHSQPLGRRCPSTPTMPYRGPFDYGRKFQTEALPKIRTKREMPILRPPYHGVLSGSISRQAWDNNLTSSNPAPKMSGARWASTPIFIAFATQ
jgi:hypothetical protein